MRTPHIPGAFHDMEGNDPCGGGGGGGGGGARLPVDSRPVDSLSLQGDLERLSLLGGRRRALRWLSLGAAGALPLAACGGGGGGDADSSTPATTGTGGASTGGSTSTVPATGSVSSCTVINEETQGPYPADGSSGGGPGAGSGSTSTVNALVLSGIVRQDIRPSLSGTKAVAPGIPLQLELQLLNTRQSCAPLQGFAIYVWHCDRNGDYSMYSSSIANESFLRGVQETDANGRAVFTTIFPACYQGRYPHIHLEVYPSLARATSAASKLRTSQLTFPADVIAAAYATAGYERSVSNMRQVTLASDNVFNDDQAAHQIATVSGSASAGYVATLQVGIAT